MIPAKEYHNDNKLLKHLDRLAMLEKEGYTYPILVDLDLTNNCNNKCPMCISSVIAPNRSMITMPFETAKDIILQLKEINVRAITFAGGGDPTCHPNLAEIIRFVKQNGMDVALFSNGYYLTEEMIDAIVDCCTWVRISLDGFDPESYKATHGMEEPAFRKVLQNISLLVKAREKKKSKLIIGVGYILCGPTVDGIYKGAELAKDLGVDYIRFRPFFKWDKDKKFTSEQAEKILDELKRTKELETKNFSISYSEERCGYGTMTQKRKRAFGKCYFPHIFTSITPDLEVYPCCAFKNKKGYLLGSIKDKSFKEIWLSEERKKVHDLINLQDCPNPCQFEKYAEFLWKIKQPIPHSNFL